MRSSKLVVSWSVGWSLVVTLAGCGPGQIENEDQVEERGCADVMIDSAQVEYLTGDDRCAPGPLADPDQEFPHLGACGSTVLLGTSGRFSSICVPCGGFGLLEVCRPLVCEVDEDCPSYDDTDVGDEDASLHVEYECRDGLCQNADVEAYPPGEVDLGDANVLCNAPLERGVAYEGPDPCPGGEPGGSCPLPLPDVCLQP